MIAGHLSQTQLAGYGRRTLAPHELLAVDRHLASCAVCHELLTRILPSASQLSRLPHHEPSSQSAEEAFHLDYDQYLVAYVDGTADDIDREIVESHVALCSECADDLRDLQEFKHQPVTEPARDGPTVRLSSWIRSVVQWPRSWDPQLTAALVIGVFVLTITAVVLLWTTGRMPQPWQQANHASPPEGDKKTPPNTNTSAAAPAPVGAITDKSATHPAPPGFADGAERRNSRRDGELIVTLNDGGGQVTLNQGGHLTGLGPLSPDLIKNLERLLKTRTFHLAPLLADLADRSGRLRGGPDEQSTFLPLEPLGVVIESDRPTLRWRAIDGASDYDVTIYDSRLRRIETSGPLAETEWTPSRPLPRGVTYSWQISAMKDGRKFVSPKPPAGEARFRVLDSEGLAALENGKRLHATSHLVMGVAYWKQGLIAAAEREFQALVDANPASPVALDLLRNLRETAHQPSPTMTNPAQ